MKLPFKNLSKSLLVAWGFSYAIVISILLIVIVITVGIFNQTIEGLSYEFNDYIFESATRSVNDTLLNMNNLFLNLTQNDNLSNFLLSSKSDVFSQELTYNLISDIKTYNQFIVNVDLFFIYLKDTDKVLSTSGISSGYLFYSTYFNPAFISFEEWKAILSESENLQYISMPCRDKTGQDIDTIAMLFQISDSGSNAVGAILSNKLHFVKSLEKISWKNLCDIYVYNRTGNLVMYDKHSQDGEIPRTIRQAMSYNDKKNSVYVSDVIVNNYAWKVAAVVPTGALNRSLAVMQALISGIILFSMAILFFVVRYILRKNYRPIKTMLSFFGVTDTKHEYKTLYAAISNTLHQNSTLLKDIEDKNKKLRRFAISRIVKGGFSYLSPQEHNDEYKSELSGRYFSVLSFYIKDISELFCNETNISNFERQYYLSFIIDNVVTEIFNERSISVYVTEIDELVVCLANFNTEIDAAEIERLADSALDFIKRNFDISLTFALSDICEGLSNVPKAYDQTVEILDYKRMLGIEAPMTYNDIAFSVKGEYIFDLNKEQALIRSIREGNHKDALSIIKQTFEELEKNKRLPLDYIIYVVLDIASTVTKSANKAMSAKFDFHKEVALYTKIKNSESLNSLNSQITAYVIDVCDAVKTDLQSGKGRVRMLATHIEKYVHDNYSDPNLNVNSIGMYFNANVDYISEIFRNETGKSLLDYINQVRIEHAKELINEGRYLKKDIARMVGFTNERTFYRVLKKYSATGLHDNQAVHSAAQFNEWS